MSRIYISGPLTNLPDDEAKRLKAFYENIAQICKELHHDAYLPHNHTDPSKTEMSPHDVYLRDSAQIAASDLVIAYVGKPSLGVGIELEIAHAHDVPVILLYEDGAKVSRAALGVPTIHQRVTFAAGRFELALETLKRVFENEEFRSSPSEHSNDERDRHAEIMARRIAARTPGAPAAILSWGAMELLQTDDVLRPFWRQDLGSDKRRAIVFRSLAGEMGLLPGAVSMRASLDIHVGTEMLVVGEKARHVEFTDAAQEHEVQPGELAIIKSQEYFYMPSFLAGLLVTPVHSAMGGVSNISTMLDPNFDGFLLVNVSSLSRWPLSVRHGMVVSRVAFVMVAHVGKRSSSIPYPWSHSDLVPLSDILANRIDQIGVAEESAGKRGSANLRLHAPQVIAEIAVWLREQNKLTVAGQRWLTRQEGRSQRK